MVLVTVREHQSAHLVAIGFKIRNIRHDDVDAEHIFVGETEPAVDYQYVAAVFEQSYVLADLADSAERDDLQFSRAVMRRRDRFFGRFFDDLLDLFRRFCRFYGLLLFCFRAFFARKFGAHRFVVVIEKRVSGQTADAVFYQEFGRRVVLVARTYQIRTLTLIF